MGATGRSGTSIGAERRAPLVDWRDRLMRPYGLTIHPNVIGGYFTVALLCMAAWLVVDRDLPRWRQAVRFGAMGLILWGLCLTFSRSAWGALAIGLALIGIAWWRK